MGVIKIEIETNYTTGFGRQINNINNINKTK